MLVQRRGLPSSFLSATGANLGLICSSYPSTCSARPVLSISRPIQVAASPIRTFASSKEQWAMNFTRCLLPRRLLSPELS